MKIDDAKLLRQMRRLPREVRGEIVTAVTKSTEDAARVARSLAPELSGKTKAEIRTEYHEEGTVGEVVVIDSDAPRPEKDRAYSIEHGRKKGNRGTTEGAHFVKRARQYGAEKWGRSVKRAVNKAARKVTSG